MAEGERPRPPVLWRGAILLFALVSLGAAFLTVYFIIPRVAASPQIRAIQGGRMGRLLEEMAVNFRSTWWIYTLGAAVLSGLALAGKIDPVVRLFAGGAGLTALAAVAVALGVYFLSSIVPAAR